MSLNHVRRLVSGGKARFVDHETSTDLDLVYARFSNWNDKLRSHCSMGYPATGAASLYRNKRRDVLRFINARHGEKWWIWNLCPLYENAYTPETMHNRVSRYPFPDHHPPPLPLLPLAVREMTAWLAGDEERIAIIHCKAGKGRSGTLLCSYLLSLPELPPPPHFDTSHNHRDLASRKEHPSSDNTSGLSASRIESEDEMRDRQGARVTSDRSDARVATPTRSERIQVNAAIASSSSAILHPSLVATVNQTERAVPAYRPIDIGDEGDVSEEGQWDRADAKVDGVFKFHSGRRMKPTSSGRGVSIPSPWQKPFVPLVVGGGPSGQGKAFASVARYTDEYVEELKRRGGTGEGLTSEISWGGVGGDGKYDTDKMFRKCGKLVPAELDDEVRAVLPLDYESYVVHHLEPSASSLVLDRAREFRLKFQLGSVPLGWAWLIPAFHLPEPEPGPHPRTHTLIFPRSQLDFPLGPGAAVHRILVRLQEVPDSDEEGPARLMDEGEEKREGVYESRAASLIEESE